MVTKRSARFWEEDITYELTSSDSGKHIVYAGSPYRQRVLFKSHDYDLAFMFWQCAIGHAHKFGGLTRRPDHDSITQKNIRIRMNDTIEFLMSEAIGSHNREIQNETSKR